MRAQIGCPIRARQLLLSFDLRVRWPAFLVFARTSFLFRCFHDGLPVDMKLNERRIQQMCYEMNDSARAAIVWAESIPLFF